MELEAAAWYGKDMFARERVVVAGMIAVSLALASVPASAREPSPSLERVLWMGPSPGAPSDGKRAVLTTLYSLSAASLVGAGYFALRWVSAADDLQAMDARGVCFELATRRCSQFMDAQADVRAAQRYTAASAAATMGLLLSGVLVAQYWQNVSLGFGVSPNVSSVQIAARF